MRIDSYEVNNGRVIAVFISDEKRNIKQHKYEPARPHGEWIFDKDFPMLGSPYGSYKCSECGMHTDDNVDHYCWFCGADMRTPCQKCEYGYLKECDITCDVQKEGAVT